LHGNSRDIIPVFPSSSARLEWVKNPAKHTLQPGNKPLLTEQPAGAFMPTYQNRLLLRHAGLKQRPPIVHQSQQGSNLYQSIINAFHMRRRTAPWVPFRLLELMSRVYLRCASPRARRRSSSGSRHRHQVHMVRHKAVGPYLNPAPGAPFCHHTDVRPVVIITKERRLPAVSPLRDRVR